MPRGHRFHPPTREYDYVFVLDVEATCVEDRSVSFKQEIIEFPIVLIHVPTQKIIDEFKSYVRPLINPVLTEYCLNLTGITQQQVDEAPTFPEMLDAFHAWASQHVDLNSLNYVFLTDGPFDIRDYVYDQCTYSAIPVPRWARHWVDIRRIYRYSSVGAFMERPHLRGMLEGLNLQFEGRPHSGIDDARNIAKIALVHLEKGVKLNVLSTLERGLRDKAARRF